MLFALLYFALRRFFGLFRGGPSPRRPLARPHHHCGGHCGPRGHLGLAPHPAGGMRGDAAVSTPAPRLSWTGLRRAGAFGDARDVR